MFKFDKSAPKYLYFLTKLFDMQAAEKVKLWASVKKLSLNAHPPTKKAITYQFVARKMKLGAFKMKVFAVAFMLLGMALCSPPIIPSANITLDDFIITNQISGWAPTNNVVHFVDSTLWDIIDGGNISYCGECNGNNALKAGIMSNLNNVQKNAAVQIFVIDYGTTINAETEFNAMVAKRVDSNSKLSIPPFSDAAAIGSETGSGIMNAYYHSGKFYFELNGLNGYDSTSLAVADASAFLTYFQSKMK